MTPSDIHPFPRPALRVVRPAHFEIATGFYENRGAIQGGATGWHFRVVASNGKTLCHSETYNSRRACMNAVEAVQGASSKIKEV